MSVFDLRIHPWLYRLLGLLAQPVCWSSAIAVTLLCPFPLTPPFSLPGDLIYSYILSSHLAFFPGHLTHLPHRPLDMSVYRFHGMHLQFTLFRTGLIIFHKPDPLLVFPVLANDITRSLRQQSEFPCSPSSHVYSVTKPCQPCGHSWYVASPFYPAP